jgi:2-polyprenyl-6-methoxyphenol hydroxylase-like FAD-dependent oxidoreductase
VDALFDALVVGAGPAGTVAALRLQQLGYRVLLVERSRAWPRPQIGEVLTPGIRNIVDLLDANAALAAVPQLAQGASRVRWRSALAPELVQGRSLTVERASFDAGLLALARQRAIALELPGQLVQLAGAAGDWRIGLRCADGATRQVRARFILDAGGRGPGAHIACAPPLAAMWAEIDAALLAPACGAVTQVEALGHGWLWGARLPGQRYRLMLVCDPRSARGAAPGDPERHLRTSCAASEMFRGIGQLPFAAALQMCAATPQLSPDSWREGRLKLGDAAFALDPISSSGVEKAMRFSLQAAVAVHTLLSDPSAQRAALTREFYQQRLIENCARHAHWTAAYYRQAWCAEAAFWQARASFTPGAHETAWPAEGARLRQASAQLRGVAVPDLRPLAGLDPALPLRLNRQASVVEMPCVIDDRVHARSALVHPNLERPLAFLEQEALFPHLDRLRQASPLAQVLEQFSACMPEHKARAITAWLWQHGILDSVA